MAQLGGCDNVTVKLSGGFATDAHWTQSSAVELVKETVKLFTPQRYVRTIDIFIAIIMMLPLGACLLVTSQWIKLMAPIVNGLP